MPIASMKKLIGVGISDERRKLLKLLTKLGCAEVTECKGIEGLDNINCEELIDEATVKLARLDFADQFLKEQKSNAKKLLKNNIIDKIPGRGKLLQPKPEINYEEFAEIREKEKPIFDKISYLEELNSELIELRAESVKVHNAINSLIVYKDINAKLNIFRDTKYTSIILGVCPIAKIDNLVKLEEIFPDVIIETFGEDNIRAIAVICLKSEKEAVTERLGEMDFSACNINLNVEPRVELQSLEIRLKEIEYRQNEIIKDVTGNYLNEEFKNERKLLTDFYNVEKQKASAESLMKSTKSSFIFEAWIPTDTEKIVEEKLNESELTLSYFTREVEEGDNPPTLCQNNSFVTPYQSVTNMFNVPSYDELNPNIFVSIFFILFFGVMISDAGYGVILTLASGFALWKMKPRKNEMSLLKIIFAGGISTIFWGIMFGGYFGIEQEVIKPVLFNPIQEPIYMLLLSLALGLLQMFVGMGINAYALFKKKQPLDAIFGVFSWYILFIGIAMFALSKGNNIVKYIGIGMLSAGLLGLMVAGSLHKRGVKKISGAFGNLYGLVNFFSDLLSYTRLFGLGLATSVIALVFNNIAMVMIDINVYVGAIMAPIILLIGHSFNIGINTLGAYVHNSRLQFVEFFGRFYEGGGRLFEPLGSKMKNYNLTQEE